jgi:hypothetical protein
LNDGAVRLSLTSSISEKSFVPLLQMSSAELTTLEVLSNELQFMVLKHLNIYDLYRSFFGLNKRFNHLIKYLTPSKVNKEWLKRDVLIFGRKYHSTTKQWSTETSKCYLLPVLQPVAQRSHCDLIWRFLNQDEFNHSKQASNSPHLVSIFERHSPPINVILFDHLHSYSFRHAINRLRQSPYDLQQLETYLKQNHRVFFEIIRTYENGRQLCEEIKEASSGRNDDRLDELCEKAEEVLTEIIKQEHRRQLEMVYEQATQIWNELKDTDDFNLLRIS